MEKSISKFSPLFYALTNPSIFHLPCQNLGSPMGGRKLKRIWRRLRTKNQGKKKSIQASVDLPGFPCHGMQSRALRRGRSGLGLGERLAQLGGSRRAGWRRSGEEDRSGVDERLPWGP